MHVRRLVVAGLALASLVALPAIATAGLAWHANTVDQESGPGEVTTASRVANNDVSDLFGGDGGESAGGGSSRYAGCGDPQPVPEPATLLLVGLGSLAVAATRRRSR